MKQEKFVYLINQYVNKTISAKETAELKGLLSAMEQPELSEALGEVWLELSAVSSREPIDSAITDHQANHILALDKDFNTGSIIGVDTPETGLNEFYARPAHRVHFLRKWGWAAAFIIVLGSAAYLWLKPATRQERYMAQSVSIKSDVAPGGDRATLTLSDGSTIVLDSVANGAIAQQGNSSVIKLANGEIKYNLTGISKGVVMLNTMRTPRGGQYQLILPDGTKAWLNAASSITYPAIFTGKKREVKVTGEAYLEVFQNKDQPFVVDVDGKNSVEVLGTRFNINSYADEANIKITLLQGSVQVNANEERVLLKPGQRAVSQGNKGLLVDSNVDLDQVMAWKNGSFNFENLNFQEAVRQLKRWYDIEVVYESSIPDIQFKGDINRSMPLSGVLAIFSALGVKTRLEGKKLIIL